jgi:hypothetical protein
LLNIYLYDLFYFTKQSDAYNFGDDNTFHASGLELEDVIINLEDDFLIAIQCFCWNFLKLNDKKWQQKHCIAIKKSSSKFMITSSNSKPEAWKVLSSPKLYASDCLVK